MKELLETYQKTLSLIFESFGLNQSYGEINNLTDVKWFLTSGSVHWYEGEDEEECANEIIEVPIVAEDHTLIYVDNECGERFYQIFYNLNRIENE
jgi:hypothetical protein